MRQYFMLAFIQLTFLISHAYSTTFYGTVRDERTHLALYQVKVKIVVPEWEVLDSTYTNIGGRWMFNYTSVSPEQPALPRGISLGDNYPNPFNPSTIIPFRTDHAGSVTFTVHDIRGRRIAREQFHANAGEYEIQWASAGPAGIYLYTIESGSFRETRRMVQLDGGNGAVGGVQQIRQMNGYLPVETLSKPAETEAIIITDKPGYLPDTMTVIIEENADYATWLQSVHDWAMLIDLHNDVLEVLSSDPDYHLADRHTTHHTDIPRLQDGGMDIQWFAVWISPSAYPDNPYQTALSFIDLFESEVAANLSTLGMATTPEGAMVLNAEGKIAGIYGVEGGHTIENSLDNLYQLYDLGMRYLTITWNNSTDWAVSAQDDRSETVGLSDFGRQVIQAMDSLGIIIDISHTGIKTIQDILEKTTNPIIATHSGVRALRNHYRNLYDDQIQAIANSGGVIGIVFYDYFLDYPGEWVSVSTVLDHIDYIVDLVGVDYVAIGSDYDGIGQNDAPSGLEDTSKYPNLTMGLINRGYSNEDIRKILGGNFMRVFEQVCGAQPAQ